LSGWKDWQIGEVVEAAEFQTFLQDQVVQVYADSSARGSALGTAVAEGMVSFTADNNAVEVYNGTDWVGLESSLNTGTSGFTALSAGTAGISYQPVSHNYIINGAFDVWQRGTSFSVGSGEGYSADRWVAARLDAGQATQENFTPAELQAIGYGEATHYIKIAGSGVRTSQRLIQRIEEVRTLAGQTVTLSFYAKDNSAGGEYIALLGQNFGSGGSAAVNQSAVIPITSSWARYQFQFTLGSMSGKTIGANSFLEVQLRQNDAVAFEMDIWGVQLEAGSVATPFKRHAPSLQGELAACQRYYWQVVTGSSGSQAVTGGWMFNATQLEGILVFPTTMRAVPTLVSGSGTGAFTFDRNGAADTLDDFEATQGTTQSILIFNSTDVSGTAGQAGRIRSSSTNGSLALRAEL
jgi:hypothetical protein